MLYQFTLNELNDFAISFWNQVKGTNVIAFHGEMGAGKTTIISALCKHKGVKNVISSPTFSIINEYNFIENDEEKKIYHIDLYRLNGVEEIIQAGVEDCIFSGYTCFVEWPEKMEGMLDKKTVHVYIKILNSSTREVNIGTTAASLPIMK